MDSKGAIGIVVIFAGLVQIVGSVTGNEAAMLAALFDPSLLNTSSGKPPVKQSVASGVWGTIGNIASHITVIP